MSCKSLLLCAWRWILLVAAGALLSLGSWHSAEAYTPVRPVLAWYYGWYDLPRDWQGIADRPPELYSSYSNDTMRRQIEQARSAGIDGFICTWQYNCRQLMDVAASYGDFGIAISIDPVATTMPTFEDVANAIRQVQPLMAHPAYLRWTDGRPILVFWNSGILPGDSSVAAFRRLRDAVDPQAQQFWLGGGDNFAYLEVFDAIQYFDISWERYPGAGMASYARRLSTFNGGGSSRPMVATVMPGYDDTGIRGSKGHRRDREGGNYYRATWDAAMGYRPQAIIITSWNEWKEGSQIEPSISYGSLYLDITREKSREYHLSDGGIADPNFASVWRRTDEPLRQFLVARSWVWGFPLGSGRYEPYREAPNGQRLVQYFDKSRMEVTDPGADRSSPWFVTNGRLTWEMVTGQMQVGESAFEPRQPADIPAAGDPSDASAPTYASFAHLLRPVAPRSGPVIEVLDRQGRVSSAPELGRMASYSYFVPETGHNVADVFWEFLQTRNTVLEEGTLRTANLFYPTFYATGFPITEPYWVQVTVAAQPRWVLIQLFERRSLTFTPDNPPDWRVEMGNVGQHYYRWRYSSPGK